MKAQALGLAVILCLSSCDDSATCAEPPRYNSLAGVVACTEIVEECSSLCDVNPEYPLACTTETIEGFSECAYRIIARRNLQGVDDDVPDQARIAAQRSIGTEFDCYYYLEDFPVFCTGCRD